MTIAKASNLRDNLDNINNNKMGEGGWEKERDRERHERRPQRTVRYNDWYPSLGHTVSVSVSVGSS